MGNILQNVGWVNLPIPQENSVTASTGETNQKPLGATIVKTQTQTITHSWSLGLVKTRKNSVSTWSNSAHKMVALSEVSGSARTESMLVASWSPH